jgi:hypothetical protein
VPEAASADPTARLASRRTQAAGQVPAPVLACPRVTGPWDQDPHDARGELGHACCRQSYEEKTSSPNDEDRSARGVSHAGVLARDGLGRRACLEVGSRARSVGRYASFIPEVPGMEGGVQIDDWWRCYVHRGCHMLKVRKMTLAAGDQEEALAEAGGVLEPSLSPGELARPGSRAAAAANSMWLESPTALGRLGLERGAEATVRQLALVLQGRHALTGKQVLQPRNGAIRSFELTFWAPESVAWVWLQADDGLRARIEHAMIKAAVNSIAYLAQQGGESSAEFAASMTLHVRTWTAPGGRGMPGPLLHVHCHLVAILGPDGVLRAPDSTMLSGDEVIRAAGAVGRTVLAAELRKLGFQIEAETGPEGRYFEIAGVPEEMLRSGVWTHAECARSA